MNAHDVDRNDNSRKTNDNNNRYKETNNEMASFAVLNVVIDQTMEEITPMETKEWKTKAKAEKECCDKKEQNNNILVPVIRIFGTLKRAGGGQPLQSACLYIHGAFPYILARPVAAGPDGSLYPSPIMPTHVNWDNRDEVEAIQGEIQATLEDTLQSSFLDKGFEDKEDDSMSKNKITERRQIIRKVTVVEGRGFYSYSPGPPASFLRVGKS
ncbi:MAG: hypothetical protein ACI8RD_000094 [Bacillariaceae sp.]|jgi:hypothetical protein